MDVDQAARLLDSVDPAEQAAGAEYLSRHAESAAGVAAALVRHVGDEDRVVAEYCVATLEELGPADAKELPEIAELAGSPSDDVAYWSATLLGRIGPAGILYAPLLARMVVTHPEDYVKERAAWALSQMGPPTSSGLG